MIDDLFGGGGRGWRVEGALIIDYSEVRRGFLSEQPIGRKKYTKLLPPQKLFSPSGKVHSGLRGVRRVV